MKNIFITAFLILGIVFNAFNQKIEFEKTEHDYGTVKEEIEQARYKFIIKNTGEKYLILKEVKPGCGCTVSEWTKDSIAPGKTGFVEAIYLTKNRPGKFRKSISVKSNDISQPYKILIIKGFVTPRVKTYVDYYPRKFGNLRFKANHLAFGDVYTTGKKTDSLKLYNEWNKPMTLSLENVPSFINYKIKPKTIEPGKTGVIIMIYDGSKKKRLGLCF